KSRKITKVPINIEEPIIDYMPKYVQLEVKKKAPVRKEPSTGSDVLTEVSEKTVLMAIGEKDKWYYLEGGGWIYGDVVEEKEIGIREVVSKPVEVIPEGGGKGPQIVEEPVDVDVDIPEGDTELKDSLCVIFGIEKYRYAPEATFANRDAEIFCEYAKSVFGIPKSNIYKQTNEGATKGEFDKVFGEKGWIEKRIVKGKSDVIIYFSGHGAPDVKTKKAYLIPHDIDPNYVSNAYSLEDIYRNLSRLGAKSVTIFLDACFSGLSREKEALLADARPLRVRPGSPEIYENITVFAASTGEEISSSYRAKKHGLFTYYLLKGLQGYADRNKDKKVSVGELFDYLKENVSKEAGFMDREQSPQLLGGEKERVIIRLK
ncbi:caspase family protein, partial [bacterium]|nr:caspase family protein [bacterium]